MRSSYQAVTIKCLRCTWLSSSFEPSLQKGVILVQVVNTMVLFCEYPDATLNQFAQEITLWVSCLEHQASFWSSNICTVFSVSLDWRAVNFLGEPLSRVLHDKTQFADVTVPFFYS